MVASPLGDLQASTPGQLPDRPVGPGRRVDAGIGPTARPRPVAVADSPIEAATPDLQHPLCCLWWPHHSSTPGQLPDRPVGLGRRADTGIGPTARPRPIAVADSPIEAAAPNPRYPMCLLHWYQPP